MVAARHSVTLVLGLVLLVGCASRARPRIAWPDAPVALRDDTDREQAVDALWAMPPGPARDRQRAEIAQAIARRIVDALEEDHPFVAAALLDDLTELWQAEPQAIGRGLAPHAELIGRLRAVFAKSGALEPTVQTLVLLAELDPRRRTAHLAELDEVLAFADELAVADNGSDAIRAQPIALLSPTALALPLPWLVDRYVRLSSERQRVISALIDRHGASMQLVRAHHDVLSSSRRIAYALARAGRADEIHRHLAGLKGIGVDRQVVTRAEIVAEQPTPDAYLELAKILRNEERREASPGDLADATAALGVLVAGLVRFPGDVELLSAAGSDARALGRTEQAIAFYEAALRGSDEIDVTLALRLGRLYGDRIARLAQGGRPRAAHEAWRGVLAFTSRGARQNPHSVWQQTAAIAESALGRGLASQGLVGDAKRALAASIERAPSIEAYETLTTIEIQTDRYAAAAQWAAQGMSLLGEALGDRYRRARLERLVGDAHRRAGRPQEAAASYLEAMRAWASLGETKDLPTAIGAERSLDYGRMMWWLGHLTTAEGPLARENIARAIEHVLDAVELDPDSPAIALEAVAFLLEAGRYRDAVDAYHRGLGAALGDDSKVYMTLWLVGAATRLGEPADRLAREYLAGRHGDTWHELLARAATGRLPFEALLRAATTGPRRAELAFYGATLGFHPDAATPRGRRQLLEQVIAAHIVFDAEYDLARLYLAAP